MPHAHCHQDSNIKQVFCCFCFDTIHKKILVCRQNNAFLKSYFVEYKHIFESLYLTYWLSDWWSYISGQSRVWVSPSDTAESIGRWHRGAISCSIPEDKKTFCPRVSPEERHKPNMAAHCTPAQSQGRIVKNGRLISFDGHTFITITQSL